MTPIEFVREFESYRTGTSGFCRFASMSTKKTVYELGFWFEVLWYNKHIVHLTVEPSSWVKRSPGRKTFVINEASQLNDVLDDMRIRVQSELESVLYCSEHEQNLALVA